MTQKPEEGTLPVDAVEQLLCTLCKEYKKRAGSDLSDTLCSKFRKRIRKSMKRLHAQALKSTASPSIHDATDDQIIDEWKNRHPEAGYDVGFG